MEEDQALVDTLSSQDIVKRPRTLTSAVRDGQVIGLTFHDRTYAAVVPFELWTEAEQALREKREREGAAA
ncbi:hypothetical protein [Amycolatopsis arida]|uniref:hypothetical protein n=1 Tax=Amycolatopsis arida TaxID=587909 RepID=UPI0010661189|nr:hypothetical protein [Amycolatopsis arida]TDX84950.1 hypothetical protein CLV69_11734 [Amycolatopsis arida]